MEFSATNPYRTYFDLYVAKEDESNLEVVTAALAERGWARRDPASPPLNNGAAQKVRFEHPGVAKCDFPRLRWFHPVIFVMARGDGETPLACTPWANWPGLKILLDPDLPDGMRYLTPGMVERMGLMKASLAGDIPEFEPPTFA